MTEKKNQQESGDELIEALLEKYGRSREAILGENGLLADLKKRVVEKALAGELTHHLGYRPGEKPEGQENHRNGYSRKTVLGEEGAMEIAIPRDREGSFEPRLIAKETALLIDESAFEKKGEKSAGGVPAVERTFRQFGQCASGSLCRLE